VTPPAFAVERRAAGAVALLSAGVCCTARLLGLHGARSAPAAIDRYILPTGRSAANLPHAAVTIDRSIVGHTDGQTGRRTYGRSTLT